jgi:hypothetical protein
MGIDWTFLVALPVFILGVMLPVLACMYYMMRGALYTIATKLSGIRGSNPRQWKAVNIDEQNDPQLQYFMAQIARWQKIIFISWPVTFVILVLFIIVVGKLGLVPPEPASKGGNPKTGQPATSRR